MAERIVSFVMSGGVGSRLWPLSREDNPKQFHDLSGDGSMLVEDAAAAGGAAGGRDADLPDRLGTACRPRPRRPRRDRSRRRRRDLRADRPQHRRRGGASPRCTRSTAIGDGLVLVVPSDHEISTERQFWETIEAGAAAAQRRPARGVRHQADASRRPATATSRSRGERGGVFDVSRFVEKPDLETAQELSRRRQFLLEHRHLPVPRRRHARRLREVPARTSGATTEAALQGRDQRGVRPLYAARSLRRRSRRSRSTTRSWSRPSGIAMVPAGFRWNDLGSWQSLLDVSPSDKQRQRHRRRRRRDRLREFLFPQRRPPAVGDRHEERRHRLDRRTPPSSRRSATARTSRRSSSSWRRPAGWRPSSRRRPTACIASGAWRRAGRSLAVRGDAAAVVDGRRRRRPWRLPRGAGLRRPAARRSPSACAPWRARSTPSPSPRRAAGTGRPTS